MYDKDIAIAQPRKLQNVFERPALKPLPPHVTERLTKGYRYYSLATPMEVLRARISPIGVSISAQGGED